MGKSCRGVRQGDSGALDCGGKVLGGVHYWCLQIDVCEQVLQRYDPRAVPATLFERSERAPALRTRIEKALLVLSGRFAEGAERGMSSREPRRRSCEIRYSAVRHPHHIASGSTPDYLTGSRKFPVPPPSCEDYQWHNLVLHCTRHSASFSLHSRSAPSYHRVCRHKHRTDVR